MADGTSTKEQRLGITARFAVGNPGGRALAVQQGMAILETAAQRAAKALVELLEHDSAPVRLAAIREINDRVYGKPKQSMDVKVTDVAQLHLQYLQEIQARREERMRTVEGHTEKGDEYDPPKPNK